LAFEFIRKAKKSGKQLDTRPKVNTIWSKHAGLQPVIDFLSSQ
jgi:hypothetical protein